MMRTGLSLLIGLALAAPVLAQDNRPDRSNRAPATAPDGTPDDRTVPARAVRQPQTDVQPRAGTPAFSSSIGQAPATPASRDMFGQSPSPTRTRPAPSPYGGYGTIQTPWAPQ